MKAKIKQPATALEMIAYFETFLNEVAEPLLKVKNQVLDDVIEKKELVYQLTCHVDRAYQARDTLAAFRKALQGEATITLELPRVEAKTIADAAEEAPYLLSYAADTFAMLHSGFASGELDGLSSVVGMLDLCRRGLEDAARKEGAALEALGRRIGQHLTTKHTPEARQ